MTRDDVISIYDAELRALQEKGDPAALAWACKATRTKVHQALQAVAPHPTAAMSSSIPATVLEQLPAAARGLLVASVSSPDVLHSLQTAHFTTLWEATDQLVAAAGITEQGRV